ncbi:MAG TPA: hypothetical protein V6C81_17135 [Planktothrix sp.]|jgi:hypothetical protein
MQLLGRNGRDARRIFFKAGRFRRAESLHCTEMASVQTNPSLATTEFPEQSCASPKAIFRMLVRIFSEMNDFKSSIASNDHS